MKIILASLALLQCFLAVYASKCNPDDIQYTEKHDNVRSMDIKVPVQSPSKEWKLTLEFDTPIIKLRVPGYQTRRYGDSENEFHVSPRRRVRKKFPEPGGSLRVKGEVSFDAENGRLPSIRKLTVPGYSCGVEADADASQLDSGKTCPLFNCSGISCEDITTIESQWATGLTAYLDIPVTQVITDGWEMKVNFDKQITNFIIWDADLKSKSSDKMAVLLLNKAWNSRVPIGTLRLKFLANKNPGDIQIRGIQFQPTKCPPLKVNQATLTTTPTPTKPTPACYSFKCQGSECQPLTCMRNNWKEGTGMGIKVPVTCDISGWELTLEFNRWVNNLELSNAIFKSKKGKVFTVRNENYNKEPSQLLDINFVAMKSGWEKTSIVSAEFRALKCRGTCPKGSSVTPAPSNCPITSCKGADCIKMIRANAYGGGVTRGLFMIKSSCAVRRWKVVITFDRPFRRIRIRGGEVVRRSSDNKQITVKNLCWGLVQAGRPIVIPFRYESTTSNQRMSVSEIQLIPLDCKCPPTTPPVTVATSSPVSSSITSRASSVTTPPITAPTMTTSQATSLSMTTVEATKTPATTPAVSKLSTSTPSAITTISIKSKPPMTTSEVTKTPMITSKATKTPLVTSAISTTPMVTTTTTIPPPVTPKTNASCPNQKTFQDVLRLSNMFYEAQRSGKLPDDMRVKWRKDSALDDAIDPELGTRVDLEGGYYDAGDYVKFGFPMAAAITNLAWGMLMFENGYKLANEHAQGLKTIKWATDYFIKCHPSKFVLYGQVGSGKVDHAYWGRPEDMTMQRPAYKITDKKPGSELAAETATAMTIASLLFRRNGQVAYADTLLKHAKDLYDFATTYRRNYHLSITDAADFYKSWSGYEDELAIAAIWLYKATKEQRYLTTVTTGYKTNTPTEYSWDNKFAAIPILLYSVTKEQKYADDATKFCSNIMKNGKRTPGGLVWISQWGSNRHAANVAFLCLVAAKEGINAKEYHKFARDQILFMLGKLGKGGRSYVVGFGNNPPQRPHHSSSSCRDAPAPCSFADLHSTKPNPQVLYGALVGGPDVNGKYKDKRTDYVKNEVTLDYNAGFQSALAGLISMAGDGVC